MIPSHPPSVSEAAPESRTTPAESRGAPRGNGNAVTHGLHSVRRKLEAGELEAAVNVARLEIAQDLGGLENLSAQRRLVLDEVARLRVLRDTVDNYFDEMKQGAIVDRRKRRVKPIVLDRIRIGDSMVKHLQLLGLDRSVKHLPSVADWLRGDDGDEETIP